MIQLNTLGLDRPGILLTAGFAFVSYLALNLSVFQNPQGLVGKDRYVAVFCACACSLLRFSSHSFLLSSELVMLASIFLLIKSNIVASYRPFALSLGRYATLSDKSKHDVYYVYVPLTGDCGRGSLITRDKK
jgi:hypothetical protein